MKKLFGLSMLLIVLISFASASKVSFSFDPSANQVKGNAGIYYVSPLVFEVVTPEKEFCRYSTQLMSYESMSAFQEPLETVHKSTLTGLSNGVYHYFVRCRKDRSNTSQGTNHLEAIIRIDNPIAAQISLEEGPLLEGKYDVTVLTTKIPLTTPKLSYSYDGVSYSPIVLYGSGTSWKGYLVVSGSSKEEIGSFRFEARDIEGRPGSEIYGDSVFSIDTRPPLGINIISALGEYGDIELEWYIDDDDDEEVDKINIYKSENPNVDPTDFYKQIDGDKEYHVDNSVESGKTYYYRIAPEDEAGNIADLSREVKATALISSSSSTTTSGLDPEFIGLVDSLLSEIALLEADIGRASADFSSLGDKEKANEKLLGLSEKVGAGKSELSTVKRDAENLKTQDLSEETLKSRIASLRVRANIILKKTPDSFSIRDSSEKVQELSDEILRVAILEKVPELSSSLVDKSVKESEDLIKEHNLKVRSVLSQLEIVYLDGTKETKTVVEHYIDSTLENIPNTFVLLKLPSGTVDASELDIKNFEYAPEKDNLVSFSSDTKQITYVVDKKLETEILNLISIAPVTVLEESTQLTGYFLSDISSSTSIGATLLIIAILGLFGYLMYMKRSTVTDSTIAFLEKARKIKELQKNGKDNEASQLYDSLKVEYVELSEKEKSKVFKEVKKLHKK